MKEEKEEEDEKKGETGGNTLIFYVSYLFYVHLQTNKQTLATRTTHRHHDYAK